MRPSRIRPSSPAQRHAFDVLHHQEQVALLFENVMDSGDPRMVERGSPLGFTKESAPVPAIGPQMRSDASARPCLQSGVFGVIDLSHTA